MGMVFRKHFTSIILWGRIEAATKGGVLLYASSEVEYAARARFGMNAAMGGLVGLILFLV